MKCVLLVSLLIIGMALIAQVPVASAATIYPTIQGVISGISAGSSTIQSFNLPVTTTAPAVYLICLSEPVSTTATWPNGWVEIVNILASGVAKLHCGISFRGSAPASNITVTFGSAVTDAYVSYCIVNADMTQQTTTTGSSSAPKPPALTASTNDTRLWIGVLLWGSSRTISSYPPGFTLSEITIANGAIDIAMSGIDFQSSAIVPGAAALSGTSAWATATISFRPTQGMAPPLTADFTINTNPDSVGHSVRFDGYPTGGIPPYNYTWDFHGGALGYGQVVHHTFTAADTYQISLTVRDNASTNVVVIHSLTILPYESTYTINIWIILFEVIAFLAFLSLGLFFGIGHDNILWLVGGLIPAGIAMVALSFQAWIVTLDYFSSIALAMVGIATILYPVIMLFRSFTK